MKKNGFMLLLLMTQFFGCVASSSSAQQYRSYPKSLLGCRLELSDQLDLDRLDYDTRPIRVTLLVAILASLGVMTLASNPASELPSSAAPNFLIFAGYDASYQERSKSPYKGLLRQSRIYPLSHFSGKYSSPTENRHTMTGHKLLAKNSVHQRKK